MRALRRLRPAERRPLGRAAGRLRAARLPRWTPARRGEPARRRDAAGRTSSPRRAPSPTRSACGSSTPRTRRCRWRSAPSGTGFATPPEADPRACPSLARGLAQQRAGDDEPLDLARALVDLGHLRVAVVALDRELLGVAVAAEDLDRLAGPVARDARGEELGLRALDRVRAGRPPSAARRATPARGPPRSRSACRRASAGWRRSRRSAGRRRGAPCA